ncbi:MAG TPA: DUF3333 domain-containing protein, partial [Steroidobacteraceae bacterium]
MNSVVRPPLRSVRETQEQVARSLRRRYRAERRFRAYGLTAVLLGMAFVVFLFATILGQGISVFRQAYIQLEIHYDPQVLLAGAEPSRANLMTADYQSLIRNALRERFPNVSGRRETRELTRLVSSGASYELQQRVLTNPSLIGKREKLWLLAGDQVDLLLKGRIDRDAPESERALSDRQLEYIDALIADDALALRFNKPFFTRGDSREPEQAGVWGAVVGSFFT